ncbi:MAG TPA: histidine kinase [Pilimelia sp.]|nr:histidine kinase [Pilimelia sp.]
MKTSPAWPLPLGLALAQLALWPGLPPWSGGGPVRAAAGVGLVAGLAVALLWRRRHPEAVLAVALVGSVAGQLLAPVDRFAVMFLADAVALFSVAVWRSARVCAVATAVTMAGQAVPVMVIMRPGGSVPADLGAVVVAYTTAAALGRVWRRWRAGRAAAAARLTHAKLAERQAGTAERHRLARELHDVTAHYLTAIVVNAMAAERLKHPELVVEALDYGRQTGRKTLGALHRMVAAIGAEQAAQAGPGRDGSLRARVDDLVTGFARLGQPVTVVGDPVGLPAVVVEAGSAVVREALTNAVRYAPGAPVSVRLDLTSGTLTVTVANPPAGDDPPATALGGGRGIAGMRERMAALGGALTAGPGAGGGWVVSATVPDVAAGADGRDPTGPADTAPRRRWAGHPARLLDATVVVAALLVPLAVLVGAPGIPAPSRVLMVGATAANAVPLFWRRTAPWRVLAAVLAVAVLLPVGFKLGVLPAGAATAAGGIVVTHGLAVYAVAAFGRGRWWTVLAVLVTVPISAMSLAATSIVGTEPIVQATGPAGDEPPWVVIFVVVSVTLAIGLSVVLMAAWGLGRAVRQRRDRVVAVEQDAVSAAVGRAAAVALGERWRIGAALRTSVVRDTGLVIEVAEAGFRAGVAGRHAEALVRVSEMVGLARAALATMRELLAGMAPAPAGTPGQRAPAPGVGDLAGLCAGYRARGRAVRVRAGVQVPVGVDASAYQIIAGALDAGDDGAADVHLERDGRDLVSTVMGVPAAAGGPAGAGLARRVAALGGRLSTDPAGILRVWLPLLAEEVTPSSSG